MNTIRREEGPPDYQSNISYYRILPCEWFRYCMKLNKKILAMMGRELATRRL